MKTVNFAIGDILKVNRGLYKHFGIYAGNSKVIHYAASNRDFGLDANVHETSLKNFECGETAQVVHLLGNDKSIKIYSPEETVKRAQSRIGEKRYNLLFNNCEHFALWCKTGITKSKQVETAVSSAILATAAVILLNLVVKAGDSKT
jgi:hypothetical protein